MDEHRGDEHRFSSPLYLWEAAEAWHFVDVPADISDLLDAVGHPRGFGSLRVEVQVGDVVWKTSVFPDTKRGCFVLPVKKAVRTANRVQAGDVIAVTLRLIED